MGGYGVEDSIVFVVDDDESVLRAIARLLDSAGYHAECFADPQDFLRRPPHDGPSCLILDLQMPNMTGLDLQEKLNWAGHALPVVFVTGHGDIPTSVRAMQQGALDFLTKPFDAAQLMRVVEAALERDRKSLTERRELEQLIVRFRLLTSREREVLALVAKGLLNKQIARRLGISEKTVKAHRGRLVEKLMAGSVAELVRKSDSLRDLLPRL